MKFTGPVAVERGELLRFNERYFWKTSVARRMFAPRLDAALTAARRGFKVHPLHWPTKLAAVVEQAACSCGKLPFCKSAGKHPIYGGWQKEASSDPAKILAWWRRKPLANVGIAVVPGCGYFVVDSDARNGGVATLGQLETTHGKLPSTYKTLTGSGNGSAHYFLRGEAATWKGKLGAGVDVKGCGGAGNNVVAAGSLHFTGRIYEGTDAPIADAPPWVLAMASRSTEAPSLLSTEQWAPIEHGDDLADVIAYAQLKTDKRAPGVDDGVGGTTCLVAARFLYRELGLADEHARPILDPWLKRCDPPWTDEEEIDHKIRDAKASARVQMGEGLAAFRIWQTAKELPTIRVDREYHLVANDVIAAIARHPAVYQKGRKLVEVLHAEAHERDDTSQAVWRAPSTPQIAEITNARLLIIFSESFKMTKWKPNKGGGGEEVPTHNPPQWLFGAVLARRADWPGVRELRAIGDAPAILSDGRIVSRRGYDAASGLYLATTFALDVPERPTREQATAAADALLDIVSEFPFIDDNHKAGWLAALLTPLAKFGFSGNVPFMLFEAAAAASGKTTLVDLISTIDFGELIARTPWSDDDAEIRKKITTCVADGDRMVLFDNVTNGSLLRSSALDAVLTGPVWKDRRLGVNESITGPCEVTWFASGNNLSVGGDLERRVLYVRLESKEDDPGRRKGHKAFKYDLSVYPRAHRTELLSHCLTMLRAFIQSGCPTQTVDDKPLVPLASFEGWSRIVRGAVAWTTKRDPCATREQLQQVADRGRSAAMTCVLRLDQAFARATFTAKDVVNLMYPPIMSKTVADDDLRDAVEELANARSGQRATSVQVGHQLRKLRGRRFDGRFITLDSQGDQHAAGKWRVDSER